jgi:Protein of unknown function (DUF4240)
MMDTTTFWKLIEDAKQLSGGNPERQVAELTDALSALEASNIIAFDAHFDQLMAVSYTRELWAAAYIINGGCSNDCFDYFRGWLIAQGEAVFHNALHNPETLVEVVEPEEAELEEILYVAQEAYERKTGQELPQGERVIWELNDELWDEETKYAMYPKLATKFG